MEAKRINITITTDEYAVLEKMAKNNGIKPTTLGMLMVKKQIKKYKDKPDDFEIF